MRAPGEVVEAVTQIDEYAVAALGTLGTAVEAAQVAPLATDMEFVDHLAFGTFSDEELTYAAQFYPRSDTTKQFGAMLVRKFAIQRRLEAARTAGQDVADHPDFRSLQVIYRGFAGFHPSQHENKD